MAKSGQHDKVLTIQVHDENLNPRTFKVPVRWIHQASWSAWILLAVSLVSTVYALRLYFSERLARPELVAELENEVQELKIALEKKGTTAPDTSLTPAPQGSDPKATHEPPPPGAGESMTAKDGVWNGLADQVTAPPPGVTPSVKLEEPRIEWQGKYANFSVNVVYRDPGKGSQQGRLVALGRANDRIFAHPEGVLNTSSGSALFDVIRGEYFSVARFRVLKARFGPYDSPRQLAEVQVFLFDLGNRLILNQTFKYGK
jgi:hypothetical protein